jgi:hypothetical protein
MSVVVVMVGGYAAGAAPGRDGPAAQGSARRLVPTPAAAPTTPTPSPTLPPVYDVTHLLRPDRDYLGVAVDGAPRHMDGIESFARRTASRPNIITIYQSFRDEFAAAEVRRTYVYGALPIVRWEPYSARLVDIARGRHDPYLKSFAAAVRALNLPMAMTFAHEMNGHWYPWGATKNKARDFVAAWRRIHRIFSDADAGNVIWAWTPNVISGAEGVRLAGWYPGDAYVDWIGIDGYFTNTGPRTYRGLFGPTMAEVGRFAKRPFLIVETGAERGWARNSAMESLFRGVAKDRRMLGFVYFNQRGSKHWEINGDRRALATYRELSNSLPYGFAVR